MSEEVEENQTAIEETSQEETTREKVEENTCSRRNSSVLDRRSLLNQKQSRKLLRKSLS
nr:hypothetical protein [Streptococcus oralis]